MKRYICDGIVKGATHVRNQMPCQDNKRIVEISDTIAIIAVADGHGSSKCPRSDRGSMIAVNSFYEVMKNYLKVYGEDATGISNLITFLNREGDMRFAQDVCEEWQARVKQSFYKNKVDGMIVTRALTNDPVIQYLESEHVPLAVIGEVKGHEALYVDDDTVEACTQMTDYLLGRRINRMALIGGNEQHTVTQKRLRGFERAHEIYYKKIPQDLVYLNCATKADVFAAVEELAEKCVECIVCMDDKICSHVLMKLNRMHLSIPKDIKVVSFYDSFFLQNYIPPVTAISFDEQELGRLACEKLIGWLESGDAGEKISPGFDLVLRASTKM